MILIQLILAHLIGDFLLQPKKWVEDKERRTLRSPYLYYHVLIHMVLVMLILGDLNLWWIAALTGITHYAIDLSKLLLQKPKTKKWWFFADQFLHLIVILGIGVYFNELDTAIFKNREFLKYVLGAFFLTTPVSIIMKMLLSTWTPSTNHQSNIETESLSNAGKYIGILERLLVFTFISVNHWEGVGFMIAAKSIFRFSDLAQAKQRKLTEYVLIGTLLSFGIAVCTAILINYL